MIKKIFLFLCLCASFVMNSNAYYINNKTNQTYSNSNSANKTYSKSDLTNGTHIDNNSSNETYNKINSVSIGLANKELFNCLIKIKPLEKEEKVKNVEKAEKDTEIQRKAHVCFDSYDIGIPSGITYEEMANVLNNSHYESFFKFSNAFVDAEREYKVNALALVAISGAESGWNKSERANDGSNNITGMNVQSDVSMGTIYNSKYDCIMDLARQLRLYYLTPGSNYYKGVSTSEINIYYSADKKWYKTIDKIGNELIVEYNRLYR